MEVYIQNDFPGYYTKVYAFDRTADSRRQFYYMEGGNLIKETQVEGEDSAKPLFIIPTNMVNEFMLAFVDALNKQGIKPEEDSVIKGKLIATEKHLGDMQSISHQLIDFITNKKEVT